MAVLNDPGKWIKAGIIVKFGSFELLGLYS
jgi:hypothetical protein